MLTSLESALEALLDGLAPVAPVAVPLGRALGRVAAEMPPQDFALPRHAIAAADGFALRALDLAGASAWSPVPLSRAPEWVEAGEAMPEGCDCVLDSGLVDLSGPVPQALEEAAPGQAVRRAGEDMAAKRPLTLPGSRLAPVDRLALRNAGLAEVAVRVPSARVIDVASASGQTSTSAFVLDELHVRGAAADDVEPARRDASSIAEAIERKPCDLRGRVGGTGRGRADRTASALAGRGALIAHGIALQPGETAAIGRLGKTPVIALPGMADQAFSAWLALGLPLVDRLSGRAARQSIILPLCRKIASTPGIAEIVLVKQEGASWMPLAAGGLPLDSMRLADAWLTVPAGSEGHASGSPVAAFPLRDPR